MSIRNGREPLVSVATPVYNGEKYIAECVESVLAQSYSNWEYVIVNNRSTDRTLEIIRKYAERDSRVKVHNNEEFLSQTANFNAAIGKISPESEYCLLLMADDWLFPECLKKKVELAEAYPAVGLVGSYRLTGARVTADGIPYPSRCTDGRKIGREYLVNDFYLGSPSNVLMRADLVRKREMIYDEDVVHSDRMAFLDFLTESDFGFVHEVLTFDRRHESNTTTLVANRYRTSRFDKLLALNRFGRCFFNESEYEREVVNFLWFYYRFLWQMYLSLGMSDARRYHREKLREIKHRFRKILLMKAFLYEIIDLRGIMRRVLKTRRSSARKGSRVVALPDRTLDTVVRERDRSERAEAKDFRIDRE